VGSIRLDNGAFITESDRPIDRAIGDGQVTGVVLQQPLLFLLTGRPTEAFQFGWRQTKLKAMQKNVEKLGSHTRMTHCGDNREIRRKIKFLPSSERAQCR
jgi:hypothetical protein